MQRDFKGIWIPKEIWLFDGLSITEKVFLSEIDSLDKGEGCFAFNSHFSEIFKLSKNRCSEIISKLNEKGFLTIFFNESNQRRLKVKDPFGISNPPSESRQTPSESRQLYIRNIDNIEIIRIKGNSYSIDDCLNILTGNKILIESIAMQNRLKSETIISQVQKFLKHSIGIQSVYNNHGDFYSHFSNWIRKQSLKDVDVDKEFSWFMKMFNSVSRRKFKGTAKVRNLFVEQLENGYSGQEMEEAVRNLYDNKNHWHAKTGYENATPEFLLTGDRMNKFLNVKYSS